MNIKILCFLMILFIINIECQKKGKDKFKKTKKFRQFKKIKAIRKVNRDLEKTKKPKYSWRCFKRCRKKFFSCIKKRYSKIYRCLHRYYKCTKYCWY